MRDGKMDKSTEENTDKRLLNLRPAWKPGESGNPNGLPKGTRQFATIFEEAIKIIVKEQRLKVNDPELELVIKGITQAFKGNYSFWKDIMDRTYGGTSSTYNDNRTQTINNYQPTEEDKEKWAIKYLEGAGYEVKKA